MLYTNECNLNTTATMLTLTHVDSFYDAIIPKGIFLDLSTVGVHDNYTMFTHIHDVEIVSLDVFK